MEAKERPLFEMAHTRMPAQKSKMERCIELGICPFCWENLAEWHDAPVLKYGKFWAITGNDYPYPGAKHHYLAIYKNHVNSIAFLPPEACHELFLSFFELCQEKNMKGATILMRYGEMKCTGATVFHLHAQIISGASLDELIEKPKYPDSFITSVLGYKIPEKPK